MGKNERKNNVAQPLTQRRLCWCLMNKNFLLQLFVVFMKRFRYAYSFFIFWCIFEITHETSFLNRKTPGGFLFVSTLKSIFYEVSMMEDIQFTSFFSNLRWFLYANDFILRIQGNIKAISGSLKPECCFKRTHFFKSVVTYAEQTSNWKFQKNKE